MWPRRKYSKAYDAWRNMKRRCNGKHRRDYKHYGGRGITYDPAWESYDNFIADMGESPEGTFLDRIDNDKGYFKENCRWTTPDISARNRRVTDSNISGVMGVARSQGRWRAYITVARHLKHLGHYDTIEEATKVRKAAEQKYWA